MMLLILFFFASSYAQDSSDLFTQANSLYQKNDCAAALKAYDLIPSKGAATWYNMGNCAYKLNDQIRALLYWKRAYQYGNRTIRQNIASNMKTLTIPHASLAHPTSPLVMQILFFFIFGIFLIIAYFLIQAKRWILLAMSVSVLVYAGRITYKVSSLSHQALVMQDDSSLRAGPGDEYHQISTIPIGTSVAILKQQNEWSQISVNDACGWIESKQIEKI